MTVGGHSSLLVRISQNKECLVKHYNDISSLKGAYGLLYDFITYKNASISDNLVIERS